MGELGWLTHRQADVPAADGWLTPRERAVLRRLRLPARRAAWRLGRWTAKAAVGAWTGLPPERIEVRAADDGAPEAWCHGRRLPVSVSLSHRAGRALAVVATAPHVVGCDLERLEPRSDAFVRGWLSPAEQAAVTMAGSGRRPLMANLIWSAKEASAKVRREGLRLSVQRAVVTVSPAAPQDPWPPPAAATVAAAAPEQPCPLAAATVPPAPPAAPGHPWRPLSVDWRDGTPPLPGWWRCEPAWVMVVAAEREMTPPVHRLQ